MSELIEDTVTPRVSLPFFSYRQRVIEASRRSHDFLLANNQFFRLVNMFLTLMSVMIRVSTRVKLLIDCNDQRKAVSTDNFLCCDFSLDFSKGITVLEGPSSTSSLFIVACSICFVVGINHH